MYKTASLYKYAAIYKKSQLIKACNYILYIKEANLYGPTVANVLREKRAGALWNGAKLVGGTALSLMFPVMGAWGGGKAGYQIGDWASAKLGWDPNGFGANALRLGGAAAGAVGGWYLGRGFNAIGRTAGGFAKGLLGIKDNSNRLANFMFGGAGTTLGMGGLVGMYAAGKPQEWLESVGESAENSANAIRFDNRAQSYLDRKYARTPKINPTQQWRTTSTSIPWQPSNA